MFLVSLLLFELATCEQLAKNLPSLRRGLWGDESKRRKATITPPENMELSSQIDKVIW
jgi:hypothetical protein